MPWKFVHFGDYKTIINDINVSCEMSRQSYYDYVSALEKLMIIEDISAYSCNQIKNIDSLVHEKEFLLTLLLLLQPSEYLRNILMQIIKPCFYLSLCA